MKDKNYPYENSRGIHESLNINFSRQANTSQNELLQSDRWDFSDSLAAANRNGDKSGETNVQQHELTNFSSYPSNPFTRQETPDDPFDAQPLYHPTRPSPVTDEGSSPFSDGLSDKDHIAQRLRENEKNRRKLANRLPHYHVTKLPYFSIIVSIAQIVVFVVELVRMGLLTGSPFQTQPYFNPMLGPSTYLLVNMGARYVPCMHPIDNITLDLTIQFPCPNSTTVATNVCNLSQLCGMGGIPIINNTYVPDQRVRVVTPIFLHAGFLHILFNLLLQLAMGMAVERHIGFIKYGLIYMCSGVAGFLLGANFAPNGIASTGASGSLFGIIATNLLLFIYCGRKNTNIYFTKKYTLFIIVMVGEIIVSFVLGLLPGLDNFSHIGGFCMGLLTSIALIQDPSFVYIDGIYTYDPNTTTWQSFVENWNPLSKIQHKVRWKVMLWAVVRVICMALVIVYFVLLTQNLYSVGMQEDRMRCSWCKYINCIPVHGWCEMGEVTVSSTTTTPSQPTGAFTPTSISALPSQILNNRGLAGLSALGHSGSGNSLFLSLSVQMKSVVEGLHSLESQFGTIILVSIMALLSFSAVKRLQTTKE